MKYIGLSLILLILCGCLKNKTDEKLFSFFLVADMRNYTGDNKDLFRGVCEAISTHDSIEFIISPGDIDPPDSVLYTIKKYISEDIKWYPVVGNHEAETPSDMAWLREYNKNGNTLPNIVHQGPTGCEETTYSFDYFNTHFVILNLYYDGICDNCTNGEISDSLYYWLRNDLELNKKKNILVIGHEPAYPFPDIENQRYRHIYDCLNQQPEQRDRFVSLLQENNVLAYIFGHTHNYSVVKINKLWHMDVSHSRGRGDPGARSTYIKVNVSRENIHYETYRLNPGNSKYELTDNGYLN